MICKGELATSLFPPSIFPGDNGAIGTAIKDRAKPGEQAHKRNGQIPGGGNLPPPRAEAGKVRDTAAAAVGMSPPTYEKAKKVVDAAGQQPPARRAVNYFRRSFWVLVGCRGPGRDSWRSPENLWYSVSSISLAARLRSLPHASLQEHETDRQQTGALGMVDLSTLQGRQDPRPPGRTQGPAIVHRVGSAGQPVARRSPSQQPSRLTTSRPPQFP